MLKQEQKLFLELCKFKNSDRNLIMKLLKRNASAAVLGELFFNRMPGVAYSTLEHHNLLGNVNREFRNSLQNAYIQNVEKNKSFSLCIQKVASILNRLPCRYAMLKGAVLCKYYPEGHRTSNDIDLLISKQDVTLVGNALYEAGFRQGHIRSGKFTPASRQDIILSTMTRGETIPYILQVNLPFMTFLEVDINFSLDYKNSADNSVEKMLERAQPRRFGNIEFWTLNEIDFFIHLCVHLYKEATTMPWIEMKRDMTLYKFLDIYTLLSDMTNAEIYNIFLRAEYLTVTDICSSVILWTNELLPFNNSYAIESAQNNLIDKEHLLHQVASPQEKKTFTYTTHIYERFFAKNRLKLLKEIKNEKTANET